MARSGLGNLAPALRRLVTQTNFNSMLGIEPSISSSGRAELSLQIEARHLNRVGTVHGGLLMTMLDTLMGYAATAAMEDGSGGIATSAMTTHFLEAVSAGEIIGAGQVVADNGAYLITSAELHDADGRLIASAQGQFSRLRSS